jgi:cell division protein FtsB
MKKSSKPTIFLLITLLLIVTVFALASVGLKLKYEQFLLQKDKAEKTYKTESQRKIKLTAEFQTVTAEERIVAIAGTELGLIRNVEPAFIIKYDSNKLEEINETLKEKYE